ncbi:MAG: S24/S26 family peptidase, partial [Rhodanobacteraceae bacterium]
MSEPSALAVRSVLAATGRAFVRMQGSSMNPALRAAMRLELEPVVGNPARSDVVVFPEAGQLIAHRVVGGTKTHVLTSGDAQPHRIERVPREIVIGRVRRIVSERGETQVDLRAGSRALFGQIIVWTRALRAIVPRIARARSYVRVHRRGTSLLCDFVRAALRADTERCDSLFAASGDEIAREAIERRCLAFVAAHTKAEARRAL